MLVRALPAFGVERPMLWRGCGGTAPQRVLPVALRAHARRDAGAERGHGEPAFAPCHATVRERFRRLCIFCRG